MDYILFPSSTPQVINSKTPREYSAFSIQEFIRSRFEVKTFPLMIQRVHILPILERIWMYLYLFVRVQVPCCGPLDVSYMYSVRRYYVPNQIKKHQIPKCSANHAWRNLFRLNYGVRKRVACSYKMRTISPAVRDTEPCRLIGYFLCR